MIETRFRSSSGKHCFVPRYDTTGATNDMDMVKLRDLQDYESLPLTPWNIKQPEAHDDSRPEALAATDQGLDLLLVPGLAFTEDGRRLGRGKGFYDKYLERSEKVGRSKWTLSE